MFWGLILEPGKRYAQTVRNAFHISMATLDISAAGADQPVSVILENEGRNFHLCSLSKSKQYQQPLDLNFETKEQVVFYTTGSKIPIHLTGYIVPEEQFMSDDEMGSEEEESEEDISTSPQKRKAIVNNEQPSKKQKINDLLNQLKAKKGAVASDSDEDDSDDDDTMGDSFLDDEASEDEDESDEEETPKKIVKPQTPVANNKTPQKGKNQTPGKIQQVNNKSPQKQQTPGGNKQGNKTPNQQQGNKTPNVAASPMSGGESPSKKKKKNKKKKNKGQNNEETGSTPTVPTPNAKPAVTQQSVSKSPAGTEGQQKSKKAVLRGGVVVQDLKEGNGPEAKLGRHVSVHYIGKLQTNQKTFDSSTQGPGFRFKVGQGEVIKGWDVGVAGMKVGGKRKINIPFKMAYGNQGMPPAIPPKSNLVFEVELKAVH